MSVLHRFTSGLEAGNKTCSLSVRGGDTTPPSDSEASSSIVCASELGLLNEGATPCNLSRKASCCRCR